MRGILRFFYHVLVFATAARVVVTGGSMHPALDSGEYVLFNRLAYLRRRPKRGDVVLLRGVQGGKGAMVKRVVGIPGDSVQLLQGLVLVNDAPVEGAPFSEGPDLWEPASWLLGEEEYFLLGDARDVSTDSRSFGPGVRRAIRGRAWLVYWPLSRWRRLEGR
ncbi:MAG: lepB [Dehalococcoidia bacterium]|nr:lepB [Dehalococcoidia bacterium]